jgi:hypothetical protein
MTDLISKDIVDLQDIEKVQFLQSLQTDPSRYASYIQDKKNRVLAEAEDAKRASFAKVSADMARLMDMDNNSRFALERSTELLNTQEYIYGEQAVREGAQRSNEDLTRRQVEINNWYYEDKRETLFVLQVVFLVMLAVVIVLTLVRMGLLSAAGGNYAALLLILVGAGVGLYRWYYTAYVRDRRFWSRRYFDTDGEKSGKPSCHTSSMENTISGEAKRL